VNYDDDGTNESDRREPPTKKNARKNAWKTDSATVVTAATYGTNHSEFDALQKQIAALKAALEQQREAMKKEHEQLKTKVDSNEKLHAREHQAIRNELDHLETTVSNKVEGIEHTIDELQERTDMIEKQTEKLQIEQTSTKTDTQECLTLLRMLTANMTNTNTTSTEPTTTDMMSGTEQSMTESSNVDTQEMSENPPNGNDTNPATTASMDTETEQDDSNQQWNTIPLRIRPKALLSRSRNKTTKATKPTNTAYTTTTTTNPSLYARAAGTGIQTPNRINAKDPHETPLAQVDNSKRTRSERTPTYDTPMRDPRRRLNLNTPRAAPLNSKEEEDEPNWQDENWDEQDSNDEVNRSKNYYSHLETFDEDDENNGTDDERNDDSGAGAEKPSPKSS
jgi:phage shock protein A